MSTKQEIDMLDDVVEEFDIDTRISHHTSKFMDSKETPSDILQDSWSSFIVRNIAVKKFRMKYTDLQEWSMKQLSKFYREQILLKDGTTEELAVTGPIADALGLATDRQKEIFNYRWENGYAFTSYKQRVDIALERICEERAELVADKVKMLEVAEKSLTKVRMEIDELTDMAHAKNMSPRLTKILNHMKDNLRVTEFLRPEQEEEEVEEPEN